MNCMKQLIFVAVLALISQAAQAGVRFYAKNATPNYISYRFSGDDTWHFLGPNSEPPSFFNNGMSTLDEIEWVVPKKTGDKWTAIKHYVRNAGIREGNIDHLVIKENGKWSWEGVDKPSAPWVPVE